MLITTKAQLGILTDIDMLLFCERAFRCGIIDTGALRHLKSNNHYMHDFDPSQPSLFRAFFDITSLYTGTMQQPLADSNYKGREGLTLRNIQHTDSFGPLGFFVEVYWEFPAHLHACHNLLRRKLANKKAVGARQFFQSSHFTVGKAY